MMLRKYATQQFALRMSALVLAICFATPKDAQALPIENIRLSRIASVTTTEIELGCAMRYLNHTPSASGTELQVRLALGYDCINALRSSPNSIHRPQGSRMAYLSNIEFDSVAKNQAVVSLHFERPVAFKVKQNANQYLLTIEIDTSESVKAETPSPPKAVATTAAPAVQLPRSKGPSRSIQRPLTQQRDRFVLRLTDLASLDDADRKSLDKFAAKLLYTNNVTLGRREWNELRLGFFDTEASALIALNEVRPTFPDAWISIATPDEQVMARTRRLPDIESQSAAKPEPPRAVPVVATAKLEPLPADRVQTLMADAKASILHGDFDQSIRIYTRLLQQADGAGSSHRHTAREFLGVAHQKNGQTALAKAEFEAYLSEFPDEPGAKRVAQRLASLAGATARPAALTASSAASRPAREPTGWDFYGAISQYYIRGVNLTRDDEADVLSQSELLSQVNFSAQRRGERFDMLVHGNLGYLYDLADNQSENQARASYLYLDVKDNALDLTARLGRQTQHRAGVLGRFDGMHIGYGLWRNISVNVTAGFPVDSPRYLASPDHYFYGASAGLSNVMDVLDISVFTNLQTIDGISDRQAIGADAQYHSARFNVIALVDYDASYDVLNNAMLVGNWRVNDRLTLNGRYQGGAGPFLTTRNALIGQPVNTIEALLDTYTEGQVRRLARNRTAQARYGSTGLSLQMSQRWHLNADINYSEYGSTRSSGGVAAFPATGPQTTYSGQLLGSSLFKAGDSVVFGYRHRQTRNSDANTAIFDLRYPVGDGLRFNPRIAVTLQNRDQGVAGATQQWIANPMLRLFYSWRRRYRIEFEMGGYWSDQELPPDLLTPTVSAGSIESSAYYLQVGYWMDFR